LEEEDDEYIIELCRSLSNMFDCIGGDSHVLNLINLLEKIMNIDENVIRNEVLIQLINYKAMKAIKNILSLAKISEISNELVEMIGKLSTHDNDNQKISAINIIPTVYSNLKPSQKIQVGV